MLGLLQEGLASAMETLAGQAFGAQQHRQLGIILQRVQLILVLCCIPIALVLVHTEAILLIFGQVMFCLSIYVSMYTASLSCTLFGGCGQH